MARRRSKKESAAEPSASRPPIRARLLNPSLEFVGRRTEVAGLVRLLKSGPAALVWGLGGSGKTALVHHAIHRHFPAEVDRAVRILVRPGATSREVLLEVLRALSPDSAFNVSSLLDDSDALTAMVLDLADAKKAWVVVEDAHHGDRPSMRDLFSNVAQFARVSRWVVTSREDPKLLSFASFVIALGPMRRGDLGGLARQRFPAAKKAEIDALVEESTGLPWRVLQLASAAALGLPSPAHGLFPSSSGLAQLVGALALVEIAIPREHLSALGPVSDRELRDLVLRGTIEETSGGLRLHDVAREVFVGLGMTRPDRAAMGAILVSLGDGALVLEGVRLLVEAGDERSAASSLERMGDEAFARNNLVELWRVLGATKSEHLASARTRCAVELEDARALASEGKPPLASLAGRLLWARSLAVQGRAEEAYREALEVMRHATDDPALALRAVDWLTLFLARMGRSGEAFAQLERFEPRGPEATLFKASRSAYLLARMGRPEDAIRFAEAATSALDRLAAPKRAEMAGELAAFFVNVGDLERASNLVDQALAPIASVDQAWQAPRFLFFRGAIDLDLGRLDRARIAFTRLAAFARRSEGLGAAVRVNDLALRLVEGQLAGLDRELQSFARDLAAKGRSAAFYVEALRLELAMLEGRVDELELIGGEGAQSDLDYLHYALVRDRARLRVDGPATGAIPAATPRHGSDHIVERILDAERALLTENGNDALAIIDDAIGIAKASGHRALECQALLTKCEVLVARRALARRPEAVAEATTLAEALPSRRLIAEASFFRMLLAEKPNASIAIDLASAKDVAPVAARRCAALLGKAARLDRLDRLVLETEMDRFAHVRLEPVRQGSATGLGSIAETLIFDEQNKHVRLPDGRRIHLETRPLLFRILAAISDLGGTAKKEEIVIAVWGGDYHPHRDDNRLQVSIRKLRAELEVDPSKPTRLVTTSAGYALRGDVQRLRDGRE